MRLATSEHYLLCAGHRRLRLYTSLSPAAGNGQGCHWRWPAFEIERMRKDLLHSVLHYLKHAFARSDEAIVAQWLENPYWQYFCGEEYFQHQMPCHFKPVKKQDFESLTVDSKVQEKAITYPTDGKLYERCRQHLVRLVEQHEIPLRQNYNRKAPYLLLMANRYHHAKHMKRKRKMLKQLKILVGRVYRDIERQLDNQYDTVKGAFKETLEKTQRILTQQPQDKNKLYSFHATEVECIAKAKSTKNMNSASKWGLRSPTKAILCSARVAFPAILMMVTPWNRVWRKQKY
jgi:IS5 family transposase